MPLQQQKKTDAKTSAAAGIHVDRQEQSQATVPLYSGQNAQQVLAAYKQADAQNAEERLSVIMSDSHAFFSKFDARYRAVRGAAPVGTFVPETETVEFEQPKEPELSYKEKKHKKSRLKDTKKELQEKLQKANEKADYVTDYSGYILSVIKEKRNALGLPDEDDVGMDEESIEEYESDSEYDADSEYDDLETDEDFEEEDDDDGSALYVPAVDKAEIFKVKVNPNIFSPDYFGNHFEEVFSIMRKLSETAAEYAPGTLGYKQLDEAEREAAAVLQRTFELTSDCFTAACHLHGIFGDVMNLQGVKYIDTDPDMEVFNRDYSYRDAHQRAVEALKSYVSKNDIAVTERIGREIDSRMRTEREELTERQEDMKKKYPQIPGDYFFESTYEDVSKFLQDIDDAKYASNVNGNEEVIRTALNDYMNLSELQTAYHLKQRSFSHQEHKLVQAFDNLAPTEQRAYRQKLKELQAENLEYMFLCDRQLQELKEMLSYMIYKTAEPSEITRVLMMKYGVVQKNEAHKEAVKKAAAFPDNLSEQERLLKAAVSERFKDDTEFDTVYEKIINEPFRFLMKEGKNADNNALLDLMLLLHKDELTGILNMSHIKILKFDVDDIARLGDKELRRAFSACAETVIKPAVDRFMQFRTDMGQVFTKEELIARGSELEDYYYTTQVIARLKDLPAEGTTLNQRDALLGMYDMTKAKKPEMKEAFRLSNEFKNAAYSCSAKTVEALFKQSRAAMLSSVDILAMEDPLLLLKSSEREELESGIYGEGSVEARLDNFIAQLYAEGQAGVELAQKALMQDQRVKDYYYSFSKSDLPEYESVHGAEKIMKDAVELVRSRVKSLQDKGLVGVYEAEEMKKMYRMAEGEDGAEDTALGLSVFGRLHNGHYTVAGDTEATVRETFFRSFATSESMQSIRDMDESAYMDMMRDLTAGTFLDADASEEAVEEARSKNLRGLRTYYNAIREHYESLERKYGYSVPSVTWLMLHKDEFLWDVQSTQVDNDLIDHDRNVFREDDYNDARLLVLVNYFNILAINADSVISTYVNAGTESGFADIEQQFEKNMEEVLVNTEFLQKHPAGTPAVLTEAERAMIRRKRLLNRPAQAGTGFMDRFAKKEESVKKQKTQQEIDAERQQLRNAAGLLTRTVSGCDTLLRAEISSRFTDAAQAQEVLKEISDEPFKYLLKAGKTEENEVVVDLMLILHRAKLKTKVQNIVVKNLLLPTQTIDDVNDEIEQDLVAEFARELVKPGVLALQRGVVPMNLTKTAEELAVLQPQLVEASFTGAILARLATMKTSQSDFTQRDVLLQRPPKVVLAGPGSLDIAGDRYLGELTSLTMEVRKADALLAESRGVLLMAGDVSLVANLSEVLTEQEKERLTGGEFGNGTDAEKLSLFAQNLVKTGQHMRDGAYDAAVASKDLVAGCFSRMYTMSTDYVRKPSPHTIEEKVNKALSYVEAYAKQKGISEDKALKEVHDEAEKNGDPEDIAFLLDVRKKLNVDKFRLSGSTEPLITEPFFRSFESSDHLLGIKDMPEDAYIEMVRDLSAGAYFDENTSRAEVEYAREKNERGLRTYFNAVRKHYDYLEKKYGYDLPDPATVWIHYDEIREDFANLQVDDNLVMDGKKYLDMLNPEDERFFYQVRFYHDLGGYLIGLIPVHSDGLNNTTEKYKAEYLKGVPDMPASRRFLMRHKRSDAPA